MKAKYVPDLSKQIALCEANYVRLLKLMPDFDQCEQRDFIVELSNQKTLVSLSVLERFKFTSTVLMTQKNLAGTTKSATTFELTDKIYSETLSRVLAPKFLIRLYHDANLAEVVSPSNASQLKSKYIYPNEEMYQVDEKMQLNDYLAQWLSHCLVNGYSNDKHKVY